MTGSIRPNAIPGTRTLGLFAKQPEPGQVKTRLAEATSAVWVAQVATAFLLDTVERLATIAARRVLAYAPPKAESFFAGVVKERFALIPQAPGDLGRRMKAFFEEQFWGEAERVILLGTDSPTLPPAFIEQAFQALEHADVVLGPATDGGYYLIGCARAAPPIFEQIPWSTSQVLQETVARLKDLKLSVALLPPWYDIDTLDDWRMLQGHVAAQRYAGLDPGVPHTERLLEGPNP